MRTLSITALGVLVAALPSPALAYDAMLMMDPDPSVDLPALPPPPITSGGPHDPDTVDEPAVPDPDEAETAPGWEADGIGYYVRFASSHDYAVGDFTFDGQFVGAFVYTDTDGERMDAEARHAFTGTAAISRVVPAEEGLATFRFSGAHQGEAGFRVDAHDGALPETLLDAYFEGTMLAPDATQYIRYGFYVPPGVDEVRITLSHEGALPRPVVVHDALGTAVATLEPTPSAGATTVTVDAPGGLWQLAIHGGYTGTLTATVRTA